MQCLGCARNCAKNKKATWRIADGSGERVDDFSLVNDGDESFGDC